MGVVEQLPFFYKTVFWAGRFPKVAAVNPTDELARVCNPGPLFFLFRYFIFLLMITY